MSEGSVKDAMDETDMQPGSVLKTLRTVWPTISTRQRLTLVSGLAMCFVVAAVTPAFSYCFAQLLGAMWLPSGKLQAVEKWAPILVAIAVVDGLSTFGARLMMETVAQSWVNALRVEALKRVLKQPREWFEMQAHTPGRVNECLDRNAEEMRNIVGRFVPIIIVAVTMIVVSVIWAMLVSWKLTLVVLAPLPAFIGAVKGYTFVSGKREHNCNQGAENASAVLTEILLKIRVIRALTLEDYFKNKYQTLVARAVDLGIKRAIHTSWLYGLYQSLNYGITALMFYYGTYMITRHGGISATEVLQVVNLLLFGMGTAAGMLSSVPQLAMAQVTAAQMLAYANLPQALREESSGAQRLNSPFPIQMNNMMFQYPSQSGKMTLAAVSLKIKAGQCTAIVGSSGSGKSTIVSLLLGLNTPLTPVVPLSRSPMTFAEISFTKIDFQHLRSLIGYVPQQPFLFPTTIAENIAFGLHESSPYRQHESICQAARAAGLYDFIMSLPQGYDTVVGDGGQGLSGGQAQRLCIARALVRRPCLLILDEPTSSLDTASSDMIRQTIRDLVNQEEDSHGKMAILLVTHNREMMRTADHIVVLDKGTTAEEGSYDKLVARGGLFARLTCEMGSDIEDSFPKDF